MQLKAEMSGPAKKLVSTTESSSVTRRPDNGTLFKLPTGTLALLATIGFLSLNYHCSPVEGYEHHRWRHRDRSSISHLAHHLPLAPVPPPPTTTTLTTIEDNSSSNGFESAEEEEDEEEESEKDLSSTRSSGFGLCSRCPPGFGVARRCTLVRDTVCHSCPQSYYAPSYSRKHACWPCSKCGEGLYEVQPCTGTSDTVCEACHNSSPPHSAARTHSNQIANKRHYKYPCGPQHHHHRSNHQQNGPPSSSQQQRNLLSTLTIGNKNKWTTSGNLIHFLNHPGTDVGTITNSSSTATPTTSASFPSEITEMNEEDEVALGVAQLAAFQVVLIFTAVAAILALTCRLRVFSSHEPARLKLTETYRDDGVALIEQLSES
ncbi:uncharacterized protein LOC130700370 isoform X1 [Daphnia carinata]|uniref:uncharacterized protein LOC130700370 isoform X1 n=1 Tax=Daphnia carinata TaxID=120202 RepID=UPI00257BF984|nr:uncharacterized protein LOC130700370 isoform X1 [Daphnia carinata]